MEIVGVKTSHMEDNWNGSVSKGKGRQIVEQRVLITLEGKGRVAVFYFPPFL